MQKIKIVLMIVLFVGVFQSNLFPLITSRIEGTIIDKDTKEPIQGVWINLFNCSGNIFKDSCSTADQTKTDKQGKFVFNDLLHGQYFFVAVHRDYVVYGPVYKLQVYLGMGVRNELSGGEIEQIRLRKRAHLFKNDPKRNFTLKEGEVKHFKIELEKAAKLVVNAKVKYPSGTSIFKKVVKFQIYLPEEKKYGWGSNFRDGYYVSICMPAFGKSVLIFRSQNYMEQELEINLNKGQTEKVGILFDFTNGQVVHGTIKDKITKRGIGGVTVVLSPNIKKGEAAQQVEIDTNHMGEFWFGGMEPRRYRLQTFHYNYQDSAKEFLIKSGDIKELYLEL